MSRFVRKGVGLFVLAAVGTISNLGHMTKAVAAQRAALEEIVVTARRREESLQEVPVAITALSAVEMEQQSMIDLVDLHFQIPGLHVQQQTGDPTAAVLLIRGQSQADVLLTTDSSVGLYVDGVNIPRSVGMNAQLFDLERVEVLKGPQGTLYGRNTTGGAVNLIPRRPDHDGVHGHLEVQGGEHDRWRLAGAVNLPIVEDQLAARLAFQVTKEDGWGKSTTTGQKASDVDQRWFRGSLAWDPAGRTRVMVRGDWLDTDESSSVMPLLFVRDFQFTPSAIAAGVEIGALNPADIPGGPTFVPGTAAGLAAIQSFDDGDLRRTGANGDIFSRFKGGGFQLSFEHDFDAMTLRSITGYRTYNSRRFSDLDGTPFTLLHALLDVDADFWSQELQLLGTAMNDRFDWVVGLYYSAEDGIDSSRQFALTAINPNSNLTDGSVENISYAAFAQGTYALTDRLNLTLGLRFTKEEKELVSRNRQLNRPSGVESCDLPGGFPIDQCVQTFKDSFDDPSWLATIDYTLRDGLMAYASNSRGFRGGGQNLRGRGDAASFLSFEPETATSYELGMKGDFLEGRLRANLAAYHTDYEDIQLSILVPGSVGGQVVTILTNAAKAEIRGFEFESSWLLGGGFSLRSTAALMDFNYKEFTSLAPDGVTVVDRSDEPVNQPKWTWSLSGRYETQIQENPLGVQVDYAWQDDVVTAPSATIALDAVTQDAWGNLSARIDYRVERWGLDIVVWGKNLTDKAWLANSIDPSGSLGYSIGVLGKPRQVGLTLRKDF